MPWFLFFWMFSFKLAFLLSSFTFIKRLLSSSSLSAIRVVSSAYLRLLIILAAILIPACALSTAAFHMMYSAYKLNRVTIYSLVLLLSQFWTSPAVPCVVLTVVSCPAYRFLRRQIRWSGIPISLRIFHSLLWSTHSQNFSIVNEAEVHSFWNSLAFSMNQQMLAIWFLQ